MSARKRKTRKRLAVPSQLIVVDANVLRAASSSDGGRRCNARIVAPIPPPRCPLVRFAGSIYGATARVAAASDRMVTIQVRSAVATGATRRTRGRERRGSAPARPRPGSCFGCARRGAGRARIACRRRGP